MRPSEMDHVSPGKRGENSDSRDHFIVLSHCIHFGWMIFALLREMMMPRINIIRTSLER